MMIIVLTLTADVTFELPEPVMEAGDDESDYEALHKEQLKRFRKEYAKPVRFR